VQAIIPSDMPEARGGTLSADILADTAIGDITVKGGNITGALSVPNGQIGNLTATALATFDGMMGSVVGGHILSPTITAGQVKGKSIGTISLTGGGLGDEGTQVIIRAGGGIGAISTKKVHYKASVMEDPDTMRLVTLYSDQGGGLFVDLLTPGALGNISVEGGDLAGKLDVGSTGTISVQAIIPSDMPEARGGTLSADILADTAIGAITVKGGNITGTLSVLPNGQIGNLTATALAIFDGMVGCVVGGSILSPTITAGQVKGKSIGTISLTGGSLGDADAPVIIRADGSIGAITTKKIHFKTYAEPDPDTGRLSTCYADQGGGVSVDLLTPGALGNITLEGGDLAGTLHVGSTGAISVQAIIVDLWTGDVQGGCFLATVEAATTIGAISVKAGSMAATLTARDAIGNVTLTAVKIDSVLVWYSDPDTGERFWDCTQGMVVGGPMQVTIYLGGPSPLYTKAKLGTIKGIGVDVDVQGTVPWNPALADKLVVSQVVKYIPSYHADDNGRPVKDEPMEAGGTAINGLTQAV
jgi:hypothetical protein